MDAAVSIPAATTHRRCGAIPVGDNAVLFRVWAPKAKAVELVLIDGSNRRRQPMTAEPGGYFQLRIDNIPDGQRYAFRLDNGEERSDPCSLWQPDGVTGPSAVVRPQRFKWTDAGWKGVQREDFAIYELHVGTFTAEGTFDAVIPRLAELKDLGITVIEIMPVNQFPGSRNWGYDGVLPYAAQNTYGGPDALHRLVDACHRIGLGAILDVVYNHMGPEANFIREFGPYFTDRYHTPWGDAVNYDGPDSDAVRDYVLDNARMWLEEFHFDGLRLDAVHAIYDLGAHHVLAALSEMAHHVSEKAGRPITIIGESDQNDPRIVLPESRGGIGLDGQWSDDFHHAVHAMLTGERRGYYQDYGDPAQLSEILASPFMNPWGYSRSRRRKHGWALPVDVGGDHFVVCIQNHDQVGNRAIGDRLSTILDNPSKLRLAASLLLLSPYIPLVFMGEEYGEERPFPFFCSFQGKELIQAVREGRKREFADFHGGNEEIPDPHSPETFKSAVLSWSWPEGSFHGGLRRLYRDLLKARRQWPAMKDFLHREVKLHPTKVLEMNRGENQRLRIFFNLSDQPRRIDGGGKILFRSESKQYGGNAKDDDRNLSAYESLVLS